MDLYFYTDELNTNSQKMVLFRSGSTSLNVPPDYVMTDTINVNVPDGYKIGTVSVAAHTGSSMQYLYAIADTAFIYAVRNFSTVTEQSIPILWRCTLVKKDL